MRKNWRKLNELIVIDPLWYMQPIDPIDPPDDPDDPGPGTPTLPGLGGYMRKRYTSNLIVTEEMSVADLINDVINPACRGWQSTGPNGKIRMRNKKPVDYAYATGAIPNGVTIQVDDASCWVQTLKQHLLIDPHTSNSEVRDVVAAVYPVAQNATVLTSSHPGELAVTAFAGAAGGAVPATATIDSGGFAYVASTVYTIHLDGIDIVFVPGATDNANSIAAFLAGAIQGDPRLNRKFRATAVGDTVTITAKFGTLTLNTATTMTHTAPVANPAVAPDLTATAGGSLPAGNYRVSYALHNARGHTLLSPFKEVTLAANEKITVDPIVPPAGCTVVWYVSVEAVSTKIRYHSENNGAGFVIDWPLPLRSAPMPPSLNRTGTEVMRVSAVYSDRALDRSQMTVSNVIKATFHWELGNRRSRKNVIELTYRQANADYRIVTLRERDDANIAKVKERRTEKVNGQAIDTFFQAKRISSGLLAEMLDATFFYSWSATRRALLQEEGDVVCITDSGSGVVNFPVWIEEREPSSPNGGMPEVKFVAHKYYSSLYDDSVNELAVPIITEPEEVEFI